MPGSPPDGTPQACGAARTLEVMTWRGGRDVSFQTFLALTWEKRWTTSVHPTAVVTVLTHVSLQALTSAVPVLQPRGAHGAQGGRWVGSRNLPGLCWESHWCPVSGRAAVSPATLCPNKAFSYVFGLRMER